MSEPDCDDLTRRWCHSFWWALVDTWIQSWGNRISTLVKYRERKGTIQSCGSLRQISLSVDFYNVHTPRFKSLGMVGFLKCLRKKCFMLTKNLFDQKYSKKIVILWNSVTILNSYFLCWYILKFNLFLLWQSWIFSSHYSSLQYHMILQKSF